MTPCGEVVKDDDSDEDVILVVDVAVTLPPPKIRRQAVTTEMRRILIRTGAPLIWQRIEGRILRNAVACVHWDGSDEMLAKESGMRIPVDRDIPLAAPPGFHAKAPSLGLDSEEGKVAASKRSLILVRLDATAQ